jgi:hypothetical protein
LTASTCIHPQYSSNKHQTAEHTTTPARLLITPPAAALTDLPSSCSHHHQNSSNSNEHTDSFRLASCAACLQLVSDWLLDRQALEVHFTTKHGTTTATNTQAARRHAATTQHTTTSVVKTAPAVHN